MTVGILMLIGIIALVVIFAIGWAVDGEVYGGMVAIGLGAVVAAVALFLFTLGNVIIQYWNVPL